MIRKRERNIVMFMVALSPTSPSNCNGMIILYYASSGVEGQNINMPDGIRRDQFLHWVESLTDRQTPSWLGLPNNAEKVLLTTRGKSHVFLVCDFMSPVRCTQHS